MAIEMKKLSEVPVVNVCSSTATTLIEDNGEVKRFGAVRAPIISSSSPDISNEGVFGDTAIAAFNAWLQGRPLILEFVEATSNDGAVFKYVTLSLEYVYFFRVADANDIIDNSTIEMRVIAGDETVPFYIPSALVQEAGISISSMQE